MRKYWIDNLRWFTVVLVNLYRPLAYLVPFLLGYFVFSSEAVLQKVKAICVPMSVCAVVAGVAFCIVFWGDCYTSNEVLTHWLTSLYVWTAILALVGYFLKASTSLAPWVIYAALIAIIFLGTPALYEILRRIPFLRWAILGQRKTVK